MAPEIEWDVDTSTHNQTIVKTPPPRSSSPRTKIALVIVVACGITLGVMYRSIPEPPPAPTPTIRPAPAIAVSIDRVIDQEARALETGDVQRFMRLQDPANSQWRTQQLNSFKKWGEPPRYSAVYTIVMTGSLGDDHVWADINQARDGQFFRETRFYRLYNGQWFRTAPDYSLWGDARLLRTNHFDLIYREGDDYHAQIVAQQLEKFYNRVCQDLNCTLGRPIDSLVIRVCRASDCSDAGGIDTNPVPQLTAIMSPTVKETTVSGRTDQHITVTMPSSRLSGLYFQALYASPPGNDEPIERLAIENLFVPVFVAEAASGGPERWSKSKKGNLFLVTIEEWEINRVTPIPNFIDTLGSLQDLKDKVLPTLDALWEMTPPYNISELQSNVIAQESWSVIQFIETKYGAGSISHFLNAMGPAQSMSDALQNGLNVSYADFDQEWRAWLKTQLAK